MNAITPRDRAMLITAPGAYDGIPNEVYHTPGITPQPALSSTGAKILLDESPAHYQHKILNGGMGNKREFDIGNATHLLCLEPGLFEGAIHEIEAPDYKTKAAQEARIVAYEAGKVPLLSKEVVMVRAMRDAVWSHPVAKHAFTGGIPERSYFWKDPETGVWLKARLDYEPPHSRYITDLKTSVSARPADFDRRIFDYGYHISAAHYLDALHAIRGERVERFYFVVIEKPAPHCVSVIDLDPDAIAWGRLLMRRAIRLFAECLERDRWPGYADKAVRVGLPGFAVRELEARHAAGEFAEPDQPAFVHREHADAYAAQAAE